MIGDKHVLTVEVKNHVALDKIAMAESIARKYNHELIGCDYGDDKWNECIEADHANQMMVQMAVLGMFSSLGLSRSVWANSLVGVASGLLLFVKILLEHYPHR